jgi:Domain of unknown function (DUF5915)
LDTATDLESKFEFSKSCGEWESSSKTDGSLVVAIDCTQDEATMSSGMSRELMNGIQQLRKNAGLDLKDVVEVFFEEAEGVTIVEEAVARNIGLFEAKFKDSVPLPQRFAPKWSVVLKSEEVEVGGIRVKVAICRPVLATRDDLVDSAINVLSTLEPRSFSSGQDFKFSVDSVSLNLKEGMDFWLSSVAKARATKAVDWL